MTSQQVADFMQSKYKNGFAAIHSTLSVKKGEGIDYKANIDKTTLEVVSVLFTSIFTKLEATQVLLKQGYGEEGSIVARALLENYIDLIYIIENPQSSADELAKRYRAHAEAMRYVYYLTYKESRAIKKEEMQDFELCANADTEASLNLENLELLLTEENVIELENVHKDFMDIYGVNTSSLKKNWSGKDLRKRAEAVKLEGLYLSTYRILSASSHGSPEAMSIYRVDADIPTTTSGAYESEIGALIMLLSILPLKASEIVANFLDAPFLRTKTKEPINTTCDFLRRMAADLSP